MYIMYSRPTRHTGHALSQILGIPGGIEPPGNRVHTLIRWGSSARVRFRPERVFNSRTAIRLATNKLEALRVLGTKGVIVPRIWEANEKVERYPVLGRRTRHMQGRDVILCLQGRDVEMAIQEGCTHFSEFVPKRSEFRVHVLNGEVLRTIEKVLTEPDEYNPAVWNNGFSFSRVRSVDGAVLRRIRQTGVDAVEALGLQFGAVDVILGENGIAYALEVNTGPMLVGTRSLRAFADKFASILGVQPNYEIGEEYAETDDNPDDDGHTEVPEPDDEVEG